ncbi:FtsX-like permease family protein [Streptomyces sp. NPDC008139]|uniref:FtsX-like permease family protein n=1 Tax=Streptomyces sp. NPDC008139 TaxID=3364814 RepID=UPI0036E0DA47
MLIVEDEVFLAEAIQTGLRRESIAADASHELRTPLAANQTMPEVAPADREPDPEVGHPEPREVAERVYRTNRRRALGATRRHIRAQFLAEALLLSALGGVLGSALGVAVTAGFTVIKGRPLSVPPVTLLIAVGATSFIGAVAGLYPAIRAARTHPTAALSG